MSAAERLSDDLIQRLYDELRAMAHAHLRRERTGHTLSTTALVHEAWLRFSTQQNLSGKDNAQFLAAASNTMRRILVDHARHRQRAKRGGGEFDTAASFDEVEMLLSVEEADELVVLDDALERLARANARASDVVVHRFFGGLSLEETAASLGVSAKTVQRDWLAARAWLRKEVARDLGLLQDA